MKKFFIIFLASALFLTVSIPVMAGGRYYGHSNYRGSHGGHGGNVGNALIIIGAATAALVGVAVVEGAINRNAPATPVYGGGQCFQKEVRCMYDYNGRPVNCREFATPIQCP